MKGEPPMETMPGESWPAVHARTLPILKTSKLFRRFFVFLENLLDFRSLADDSHPDHDTGRICICKHCCVQPYGSVFDEYAVRTAKLIPFCTERLCDQAFC